MWPALSLAGPPYSSDDPAPTEPGCHETYACFDGIRNDAGTSGDVGVDFNYGGAQDLQLTAVVPLSFQHPRDGAAGTGLGNIEFAARYRFLHQRDTGWDVALFPRLFVPSGCPPWARAAPRCSCRCGWAGTGIAGRPAAAACAWRAPADPGERTPGGAAHAPPAARQPTACRARRPGAGAAARVAPGRVGGIIRRTGRDYLDVEITQARDTGSKLRADQGINLPDTELDLPALTARDTADLVTVAQIADLVGLSFVRSAADVKMLRSRLRALGAAGLGIVLKIETRRAFERLPELLYAAMAGQAAGIMIARGDLAVECGYERLAEVQEEILWAAEAAHMPVIWATQVLETLAKTGLPSRAEITDAAIAPVEEAAAAACAARLGLARCRDQPPAL